MRRLTASKTHIAIHCAFFLTDDAEWVKESNTFSKTGNAGHAVNEDMTNGNLPNLEAIKTEWGLNERESETVDEYAKRLAAWFPTQNTERWRAEEKLAWDPFEDKPILIKSKKPRDYSELDKKHPFATCGTADIGDAIDLDAEPIACIDDIKTGFGGQIDPVIQGGHLVMMKAAQIGAERGRFRVVRVQEHKEVMPVVYDFAPSDLRDVKGQIRDVYKRAMSEPEANAGSWCRYCPARTTCPAAAEASAAATDLVPEGKLVRGKHKLASKPESNDHAVWLMSAVSLARAVLDRVEKGVKEYADTNGGVNMPDGSIYRAWDTSKRVLDLTDAAKELLKSEGLEAAINESTNLTAIKKAAGGEKAAEPIFKKLEAIGAITREPGTKYEARKPSRGQAA